MFYVYKMLPNRRLELARDNLGVGLGFANKDLALSRAAYLSTQHPYPYTVDSNPDLNGTVDGKADSMSPSYYS